MKTRVLQPDVQGSDLGRDTDLALVEALSLADALDVEVSGADVVRVAKIHAGNYFGSGKIAELGDEFKSHCIKLVVVNASLSPVQQRNLERIWSLKVLDRTALILEIFGARARTKEGVLQVDLAHLTYQRSRLVRSWTHLERQRGGSGFMGGPGETQIESDRRDIDNAIVLLKRQLQKVVRTRQLHRASRKKIPYPIVALVGYTNAGKSTLFNQLTGASVLQKDMVFATLDPTMRAVRLPSGREVILSDTVGFISDLPTQLVAAFRATLEEVLEADLILHVRDMSHPETTFQQENVEAVLRDLGIEKDAERPILEVWNKADLLDAETHQSLDNQAQRRGDVVLTSAAKATGLEALSAQIEAVLGRDRYEEALDIDHRDGHLRAWLYSHNLVTQEETFDQFTRINLKWSQSEKDRFLALSAKDRVQPPE